MERETSISELADAVGVGASYVTKIERGHSPRVSVSVFRKLRAALGVPYDERRLLLAFPFGEDDPEPNEAAA